MQRSNQKQDLTAEQKKVLLGLIGFGALAVIAIILSIVNLPKNVKLDIRIAPSAARVSIGNKTYKNGQKHKIRPGDYKVKIFADGFEPHEKDVHFEPHQTYMIARCLNPVNDKDFYKNSPEEDHLCFIANEANLIELQAERMSDPIYKIAPFHSYDDGFYIDASEPPKEEGDEKIKIKITALSCIPERSALLKRNALKYLEDKGINLDNYEIIDGEGCQ